MHKRAHLCSRATVSLRGSNIWSVRSVRFRTSRIHDMMSYRALRFISLSAAAWDTHTHTGDEQKAQHGHEVNGTLKQRAHSCGMQAQGREKGTLMRALSPCSSPSYKHTLSHKQAKNKEKACALQTHTHTPKFAENTQNNYRACTYKARTFSGSTSCGSPSSSAAGASSFSPSEASVSTCDRSITQTDGQSVRHIVIR